MAHTDKHEGHEGKEGSSYPQNQSCRAAENAWALGQNYSSSLTFPLYYLGTYTYYNIKDVPNALQPTCCPSHL